jgi:hypothetical protein
MRLLMPTGAAVAGLILTGLLLLPATARGQPFDAFATPEFQVNTHVRADQRIPSIAGDASGNTVVVWQSRNQDGQSWGVHGQRLNALGQQLGAEFRINVFNQGAQDGQHVQMLPDGRFVVAWNGLTRSSPRLQIQMRRFAANGQPMAGDISLGDSPDRPQILPRLGLLGDGALVASWDGSRVFGDTFDIVTRYFSVGDEALTPSIQTNQFDQTAQRHSDLAVDGRGRHVVAWQSSGQDGDAWGVFARCLEFRGGGGDEFMINETTEGSQARPRVAMVADGRFAIAWQDNRGQSSFAYQRVMVRLYDADCQPLSGEIQVNQFDEGIQDLPEISVDGDYGLIVVWQSFPPEFEQQGVYGRRLHLDGRFLGDEFRISQEIEAYQDFPVVQGLPDGGFMVAWETSGQDGSGFGIYARRFFGPGPARLELRRGGGQAVTVGEVFPELLEVQVLDQWGVPQAGRQVRFSASNSGASAAFGDSGGVFDGTSDAEGRVAVQATAGPVAGQHAVRVDVPDTDLVVFITLQNLAGAAGLEPLPVPLAGWPLRLLLIVLVLVAVSLRFSRNGS